MPLIVLTHQRFDRLVVEHRVGTTSPVKWKCICDCGNVTVVTSQHLRTGHTRSCGCLYRESRLTCNRTHGQSSKVDGRRSMTPEYRVWTQMRKRFATNAKYAERGMEESWQTQFQAFHDYLVDSIGLHPGNGYTLDRVENERGYFPGNLRWATRAEQSCNRSPYDRNVSHLRRTCECGLTSNPGAIGRHTKATGHKVVVV